MADLWQRQPFDTPASFDRFSRFYLVQEPPRSVETAYRQWRQKTGRKPAGKMPGSWTAMAWPTDHPSWPARAAAYDDHLAALRLSEWERQHMPAAEVIARLSAMARGDIGEFSDVLTFRQDLKDHPKSDLVKRVNQRVGDNSSSFQLELYSALDALEKLARHYGLLSDNITVKVERELEKALDVLQQRLEPELYQKIIAELANVNS
jgi:hypothetical protein